jgi:hypothetical protein
LRDNEKNYNKGEVMDFDGFVVGEPDAVDGADSEYKNEPNVDNEDNRVFFTYKDTGVLSFHTEDRLFATTAKPLPQGLCGAPVTDTDGDLCGTVEGVVPLDHENKNFAGAAAFIPSFVMKAFIDFVERSMVEQMVPVELFNMIKSAKKSNALAGGIFRKDKSGRFTAPTSWDVEYDNLINKLKENYSKEEYEKIMDVIDNQSEEAIKIFDTEGGDLDSIIEKVRCKTEHLKALVHDQYRKKKTATTTSLTDQ